MQTDLVASGAVLRERFKWRYRGDRRPPFAHVPQEGQESVWDYPRPPRIVADQRRVRVVAARRAVAESTRALRVLETASPPSFYVPAADVDEGCMHPASRSTHCEWKGLAQTYDVAGVGEAAWTYVETYPGVRIARPTTSRSIPRSSTAPWMTRLSWRNLATTTAAG